MKVTLMLLIECGTPLRSIDNGKDAADGVGDVVGVFSARGVKLLELSGPGFVI